MAWNFPQITAGVDILLTKVNLLITRLNSILNSFPGSALQDGTVTTAKLAKSKAEAPLILNKSGASAFAGASQTGVWLVQGLASDGAAVTRKITGWSFAVDSGGTLTKGAGNQLVINIAGTPTITIDLNDATLSLTQPIYAEGLSHDWPSGQILDVDYTYGGAAGRYDNACLQIMTETGHVS